MSENVVPENSSGSGAGSRTTWIAFILLVLVGGSNAVAVRLSNEELPPFFGAAARFAAAALIFWIILLVRRIKLPRGRALGGIVLYGFVATGLAYAFLYWGLIKTPASMTMVILAFIPLWTLLLAVAHRLEKFSRQGFIGALIALIGIIIGVYGGLGDSVHIPSLLAVAAGGLCLAESAVIYKLIPPSNPLATNAVGLSVGAAFLFALSFIAGESWLLPEGTNIWGAYLYLVVVGSVILFYLYLYVLSRWTASATAYSALLFPVATVIYAAWLLGETITVYFLIGGVLVLFGVWLGAVRKPAAGEATEAVAEVEGQPGGAN